MLEYMALIFWGIVILPNTIKLKRRQIIQIGDFLLLSVLGLVGSEFLWLYILYNYISPF